MIALIPTCSRPEMCLNVVNKIQGFDEIHLFVNNCDIEPYLKTFKNKTVTIHDYTHIKGQPKKCHNLTFQKMILAIPDNDILIIEDDVNPCFNFVSRFMFKFVLIKSFSKKKFTLSPIFIPEKKCEYTKAEIKSFTINNQLIQTQKYVDGNFAFPKELHKELKKFIKKTNFPVQISNSGISPILSKWMFKNDYPMYVTIPTMVEHGEHESLQFGEKRKSVPLIAKFD